MSAGLCLSLLSLSHFLLFPGTEGAGSCSHSTGGDLGVHPATPLTSWGSSPLCSRVATGGLTKPPSSRGLPRTRGTTSSLHLPGSERSLSSTPVHQGHRGRPLPVRLSVLPLPQGQQLWSETNLIHSQLPATTLANGPSQLQKAAASSTFSDFCFVLFFLSFPWLSENGFAHKGT